MLLQSPQDCRMAVRSCQNGLHGVGFEQQQLSQSTVSEERRLPDGGFASHAQTQVGMEESRRLQELLIKKPSHGVVGGHTSLGDVGSVLQDKRTSQPIPTGMHGLTEPQ